MVRLSLPEYTPTHWKFLALLQVIGEPVSLEIAENLLNSGSGPLFRIVKEAEEIGWVRRMGPDQVSLAENLPSAVQEKIGAVITEHRLLDYPSGTHSYRLDDKVPGGIAAKLLAASGLGKEAALVEITLANEAIGKGDFDGAHQLLKLAIRRLRRDVHQFEIDTKRTFVDATFKFSGLCTMLGKGFENLSLNLDKALDLT
ncbi:MAG: hypothetical protein JRH15_03685, partial [Deltaproteobacteria bacterium]|nr:hypothetical protein [Deltaproteobacteria bacterium]